MYKNMYKKWCTNAGLTEDGHYVQAGTLAKDPPEYSDTHADDMQTVTGLVAWLQAISQDGDCVIDRDTIADTCEAAANRLKSMQESLQEEVDRIEKLQPFYTQICAYVDGVRRNSSKDC